MQHFLFTQFDIFGPGAHFTNRFFVAIQNTIGISFHSHLNSDAVIATTFCTWHDSCAVMACAKICCDVMASNGVVARRSFHQIWIAGKKTLVKRAPSWLKDVMTWKGFPHYWPFVRGIHWSPAGSTETKGHECKALVFLAWIGCSTNSRVDSDFSLHDADDITVTDIYDVVRWVKVASDDPWACSLMDQSFLPAHWTCHYATFFGLRDCITGEKWDPCSTTVCMTQGQHVLSMGFMRSGTGQICLLTYLTRPRHQVCEIKCELCHISCSISSTFRSFDDAVTWLGCCNMTLWV